MKEMQVINKYLPESVKEAISTYQTPKLASRMTGLAGLSLDKIAEYLGGRIAARNLKWRPVAEGLVALHNLRK